MTPPLYPVYLSLAHKTVLIVGGGNLAAQKLRTLEPTGADVMLVAPRIAPECQTWSGRGALHTHSRPFVPGDLDGVAMVFAATDDAVLNHWVVDIARKAGVLANAVDDPKYCDFYTPAVVRRGAVTLAISSDGRFPGITRAVREVLDELLPAYDDTLVDALIALRAELRASSLEPRERSRILRELIAKFREDYLQPRDAPFAKAGMDRQELLLPLGE
jgi:precorrin-2 dehydrogenase/sirohydrochlorin ferrochelatase